MGFSISIPQITRGPILVAAILVLGYLIYAPPVSAQGIDPSCPPPLVMQGGTCTVDTNPYSNPYVHPGSDRDGDGIEDAYDVCPDDASNECGAQKATNETIRLVTDHHCLIVPVVAGVISLFNGPGATVTGGFAIGYGIACYFKDD